MSDEPRIMGAVNGGKIVLTYEPEIDEWTISNARFHLAGWPLDTGAIQALINSLRGAQTKAHLDPDTVSFEGRTSWNGHFVDPAELTQAVRGHIASVKSLGRVEPEPPAKPFLKRLFAKRGES